MWKQATISVASAFLAVGCATAPKQEPVQTHVTEFVDSSSCLAWRNTEKFTGEGENEKNVASYREIVGFAQRCQNFTFLVKLMDNELKNPEMAPIAIATYLTMIANADPEFAKALRSVLPTNITEDRLASRFALSQQQPQQPAAAATAPCTIVARRGNTRIYDENCLRPQPQ